MLSLTCLSIVLAASSSLAFNDAIACTSQPFNPLHHSGPASPYFDAPSQDLTDVATPEGCIVDQAAYIVRHGSFGSSHRRYPEPGSFQGWQSLFEKFQNATYTARGSLAFIPFWIPPVDDVPHEPLFLSSTGAKEAFDLGVLLRKKYRFTKGGQNITVWSASEQRVVDTGTYFLRGYLSQGNYLSNHALNRGTIITLADSVNFTFANSLTPSAACPTYATFSGNGSTTSSAFRASFQTKIAGRLNAMLDGLTLDATDVGVMQDLCGFQAEIDGDTRFCDVFEESEWLDYEYAHDLNYYYGSGPGNPISAATGYPWVKAMTDFFAQGPAHSHTQFTNPDGTPDSESDFMPPPLIMSFTHDNNLPPIYSALGLWNDSSFAPLSLTTPDPNRRFRASYLTPFRGYIALERLTCNTSVNLVSGESVRHIRGKLGGTIIRGKSKNALKNGIFVRVRGDNAPIPIPSCTSGPGSTCPLDSFITYINDVRAKASGDFVGMCGLEGVGNATDEATFFTQLSGVGIRIKEVGIN